ncbi:putative N-acetylmuramoyl-L-alanine amidase [Lachnospiraceae bacterium TWA4]|nr:putative N-acetylmuramoyl-L-alanine amidase [Lachnospiraceae bacterium TWA4]
MKQEKEIETVTKAQKESIEQTKKENISSLDTESNSQPTDDKKDFIIQLDPGHGGKQIGAEHLKTHTAEKDVNLKIALYLKEALEEYENVKVYLTREDDSDIDLEKRVPMAVANHANILISLHNNGKGTIADYTNGATVLVQRGALHKDNSLISQELGCYILKALSDIGIENQGLMFRVAQNDTHYSNGELCDYYSIIRNCEKQNIPGILIEHTFLDNEKDFNTYIATDEKIKALARADALGIASYYKFEKKQGKEKLITLKNYTEKITLITTDYSKDNVYKEKTYFSDKEKETLESTENSSTQFKSIGHRGLGNQFPGNSALSFEEAGKAGLYAAEADLRMTSDGVLCLSHEDNLTENTNKKGLIEKKPWFYVKEAVIDKDTYGHEGEKICSFDDYLDICKKYHMVALVDIKWHNDSITMIKKAYEMAKKKGMENQLIWQAPYSMRDCLKTIKKLDPNARMWYLIAKEVTKERIEMANKLGCEAINAHIIDKNSVKLVHDAGLKLGYYPDDDDPKQMDTKSSIAYYSKLGVDYIMQKELIK